MPRRSVPSADTGTLTPPAEIIATGTCSTTSMRIRCGKSVETCRCLTTGYGATAVRSADIFTSSVVMLCAAELSAARIWLGVAAADPDDRHALDGDQRGVAQPHPAPGGQGQDGQHHGEGAQPRAAGGGAAAGAGTAAAAPAVRGCRSWPCPVGGERDRPERLDLGLELDAEALLHAPPALGHQRHDVGGGGVPEVLHEVGVLGREPGAADPQPAGSRPPPGAGRRCAPRRGGRTGS